MLKRWIMVMMVAAIAISLSAPPAFSVDQRFTFYIDRLPIDNRDVNGSIHVPVMIWWR